MKRGFITGGGGGVASFVGGVLGDVAQGGSALKGIFAGDHQSRGPKKGSSVGDSVTSLFGIR